MIVAVYDIIIVLTMHSGVYALGAAPMDIVLFFLGHKEYRTRETL